MSNPYNQLATNCNDLVHNNSTTNDESIFDEQEETGITTELLDSYLAKYDEFKNTAVASEILLQLSRKLINILQKIKHEDEEQESKRCSIGQYSCMKCGKYVEKLSFLAIHQQTHTSKMHFTCPQCQYIFHTLKDLSNHCQKHSMMQVSCPRCEKCFEDSRLFKVHLGIHIIEMEGYDDEIQASEEDSLDIDRAMLYDEIHYLNEIVQVSSLGISRATYRESFPCKYCPMVCTSKVRLSIHLLVHKEYTALSSDKWEESFV